MSTSAATRTRRAHLIDTIGVLAVVTGLLLGLVPGVAFATHGGAITGSQFEIDGNTSADPDGHDWSNIASHAEGGELASDGLHTEDKTWFHGGEFEYLYPDWDFVEGGNAQKSDLHRLFVASQVSGTDSFLWLGASRLADNGSTQVTVEFNQEDGETLDLSSGYRITGDFFITWNFPGRPSANENPAKVTVKVGFWPDGRTAGAYPTTVTLGSEDYRYAIGGVVDPDAYDFIELELDLSAILGAGGAGSCGQYGAVSFRTESSGGGGGGTDESTLKDVAGPYPIDLDTCANVTVEKVDEEGNPLNGVTFSAYNGHDAPAAGEDAASCITGPDPTDVGGENTEAPGECSFGQMQPGNYSLHETDVPDGYLASPDLPDNFTVVANTPLALPDDLDQYDPPMDAYTDPRIDYTIEVAPDGRNAIGSPHTFTVTLKDDTDTGVAGADIDLEWSGLEEEVTSVSPEGPDENALDCTTDTNGQCTVVVTRSTPGEGTLSASWDTPYQNASGVGDGATGGDPVASIEDEAEKTWVGFVARIEYTATNLVTQEDGDEVDEGEHVFTVTVKEDDGSGSFSVPDQSVEVTVTWTGAPAGATITPSDLTCDTDAAGQCTFTVDSDESGAGTITVVGLDGMIEGLNVADGDEALTYSTAGTPPVVEPGEGNSLTATKTWREYRAQIGSDALNPVGQDHPFDVWVEYSEDGGATWTAAKIAGLAVDWEVDGGSPTDDEKTESDCDEGTDGDGQCTIVVQSDAAGSKTVKLLSVTGDLLPDDDPSDANLTYTFSDTQYDTEEGERREAKKTWLIFGASIGTDGHNLVSTDADDTLGLHVFTVTVWRQPAPGAEEAPVPAGTKVTVDVDWDSDEPEPADLLVTDPTLIGDNDCAVHGTSNVALPDGLLSSQCTVTVNSTVPGTATVTVTGLESYDFGGDTGVVEPVVFTEANQDSADKTWYRYRAWIDDDSTNLAGETVGDHDFNVYVQQDSGDGWGPVPTGTTVEVKSSASGDGSLDNSTCLTTTSGDTGTCKIWVSSTEPGSRDVTVWRVRALDVDGDPWAEVEAGDYLVSEDTTATKYWVDYSATISPDDTNLTGEDHVFTVKAFVDSGDGPQPAPTGTKVEIDVDSDYLVDNTCDGAGTGNQPDLSTDDPDDEAADNECYVVVTSDSVSAVTVTVTGVTPAAGIVDDNPTDPVSGVSATKTWIDIVVTTEADETNIAGEDHTFKVDVTVNAPGELAEWELDSVTVALADGGVGQIDSQTCAAPEAGSQSCTVTVSSSVPGELRIEVTEVAFTYDGKAFVVDLDDESSVGEADLQDLEATKTWRAYEATIEADDLNRVRDEHTFAVTVRYTDDGQNWSLADDVDVTVDKVDPADTGTVTDGTCTTDATGTCTVTVNSDTAGTGTFEVASIVVKHPETGADTTLGEGGSSALDVAFDNSDTADKTWAAFRAWLSRDSANITGDEHLFTVTAQYTVGGGTWNAVPDGTRVDVSASGTGAIIDTAEFDSTCDDPGTTSGTCDVWVDSGTAGVLTVTIDGLRDATISIGAGEDEIERTFDVTFGDDGEDPPNPNPGLLDGWESAGMLVSTGGATSDANGDYTATKAWASYQLRLDPETAVNLLDGSLEEDPEENHTITAILTSDDSDGIAPIDGQEIRFDIDDGAAITATDGGEIFGDPKPDDGADATCVTGLDGTCTITITRDTPGKAVVNAWYSATVGDSAAVQIDSDNTATKTWTTFRVTVTPETAVNLIGTPHKFTVTVEQSKPAATCADADDDGWCPVETDQAIGISVPGAGLTIDKTDCDDGTDAAGQCVVWVTSSTVQAVTLTATYTESYEGYATEIEGATDAVFSDSGDKSWIDYDIEVTGDAENLVDTEHTFTVRVTTTVPAEGGGTTTMGVVGATPSVFLSGPGSIVEGGNTCLDGTVANDPTTLDVDEAGTCTVTITSAVPGLTTVDASYVGVAAGAKANDTSDDETRTYDTRETVEDDSGDKLWVDYRLTLGDDATNAVDDPHTFTATLTRSENGNRPQDFLPAEGEALTFTVTGVGGRVNGGDVGADLMCTTDDAGQCDIIINSSEGGTTTVGVRHDAVVGVTAERFTDTAVKTWVDIDLVKTAVVGDGFSDGDLVEDPETGLPTLFFTSSDQGPKTAVFEYVITNTGGGDLFDLALVDDRLGGIDLSTCPDVLAAGASCTARASEQFTYQDAAGGLSNIITNVGVVTASGDDGSEVSDTDDAVIQLIAQQSSILLDLVKEVVGGAGDVSVDGGVPTVTWSEAELDAGESKVVRYRFTVTNVGPSPIVDVELVDPMLSGQPLIAVADGVTLQPGESTVVEVDHVLTADEAFPDGPTAGDVPNVATVSGANETRDAFDEDVDDAIVFVQVVFSEVVKPAVLPATGLTNGRLLPLSLLLVSLGTAILWLDRRRAVRS